MVFSSDQKRMSEQAKEVDGEATPMEDEENDTTISSDEFITGVIEGFYNRPWTRSFLSISPLLFHSDQQGTASGSFHQVGQVGAEQLLVCT